MPSPGVIEKARYWEKLQTKSSNVTATLLQQGSRWDRDASGVPEFLDRLPSHVGCQSVGTPHE